MGARGFNQYDGTIDEAFFEKITTVSDGSIGMQFSKPVGKITLGSGVETTGSRGKILVKGVIQELFADAISVLEGGEIRELNIRSDLVTRGSQVATYHVNGGTVKKLNLKGEIIAEGKDAQPVTIENEGSSDTSQLGGYLS